MCLREKVEVIRKNPDSFRAISWPVPNRSPSRSSLYGVQQHKNTTTTTTTTTTPCYILRLLLPPVLNILIHAWIPSCSCDRLPSLTHRENTPTTSTWRKHHWPHYPWLMSIMWVLAGGINSVWSWSWMRRCWKTRDWPRWLRIPLIPYPTSPRIWPSYHRPSVWPMWPLSGPPVRQRSCSCWLARLAVRY